MNEDSEYLKSIITSIEDFLKKELDLTLHPHKVEIRKFSQGIDFLGYIILPHHISLRTKTRRRMFKKIRDHKIELDTGLITKDSFEQSLQSYYGMLKHCDGYKIKCDIDYFLKKF